MSLSHRARAVSLSAAACLLWGIQPATEAAIIGQWSFNEGSGTNATDSSGNGNDGVILGGAQYVNTPSGVGLQFDGIDDMVNFGQPAIFDLTNQAVTIEAWVSILEPQVAGNNHGIFGKSGNSYQLGYEDGIPAGSAARLNATINTENGTSVAEGPTGSAKPFGTFHHILVTKSAITGGGTDPVQLYIDNVCVNCDAGGRTNIISEAVDLTAGTGNGNFLRCVIDEITFHDNRMNPGQVNTRFTLGPVPATPLPAEIAEADVDDTIATEFVGMTDTTYELECAPLTDTNDWQGTGAFTQGTGTNQFLFDPSGYSTSKIYRAGIVP